MVRKRAMLGLAFASLAIFAASALAPAPASADDARLTVTPAVYDTDNSVSAPFAIELVRHRGYYGGGWGGGYHGYRGYGWGGPWGGVYRPYYRPRFYGAYGGIGYPAFGYGYPAYGYGYGYPAYGYGPGIGFGVW